MTYEEANWAKLSPKFREAHNRLRQARGMETIPPPKVDLYVQPRGPKPKPFDPSDPEFIAAAREFHGGRFPFAGAQGEGFSINGVEVSFGLNAEERAADIIRRQAAAAAATQGRRVQADQGFTINGRPVRL